MKKVIIFFLTMPFLVFSQKEDLSKKSKDELVLIINKKENRIKELEKVQDKITKHTESENSSCQMELVELKKIITETNTTFLKEIFINKYMLNKNYFKETDLETEDNTIKFKNSNSLINSILFDVSSTAEEKRMGIKAKAFNENFLVLFEIREKVLKQKYNKEKVDSAILDIDKLPILENDWKLELTKIKISNALKNYVKNTCLLKSFLDKYMKADQKSPALQQLYTKLEKDDHYKEYPYLIKVIKEIKTNLNSYTNDVLEPCTDEGIKDKKVEENDNIKLINIAEPEKKSN